MKLPILVFMPSFLLFYNSAQAAPPWRSFSLSRHKLLQGKSNRCSITRTGLGCRRDWRRWNQCAKCRVDFGQMKKGQFDNGNKPPEIDDTRGKFYQGLFQQTVPSFLKELDNGKRNILMMDADIYTATLYALTSMGPWLKKGDIVFFDEFSVPTHEFRAFTDFTQSFYIDLELIAAANNYYFTAFKVK